MTGIELLAGGWFASPVIKSVVEKAQKYLGDNYELSKSTQGLVDTLARKLALCQETVMVAEKRMINSPNLAIWLKKLKEAAYEAEDVLDDMEAEYIKEQIQAKNKVSKIASSSLSGVKNMFIPDDNHKRLKAVVDKLNKLSAENINFLKLLNMHIIHESNHHELSGQRETTSQRLGKVNLYGRQQELNLILEMISRPASGFSNKKEQNYYNGLIVIPIVGMGGVGKTALAQAIYNHPDVQQAFRFSLSWISISYNLDVKMVMRKLIQSLGGSLSLDVMTLEDISKKLSSLIYGRRFLVVLDDMCKNIENQWDQLCTTLSGGCAPGSVVLITTQNQAFATTVAYFGPIALNPLHWQEFWDLFKKLVFDDMGISGELQNNLELIAEEIARKLHGLPLAAKIIGNILRSNINEEKWRRISRSEWWDIPEGRNQILPSIGVGYQHLDLCLRQCFAFCSIFPRNTLIDKDRLVQMWIALNFIPHEINSARKMEDTGREWFDKLVEMSFLQEAEDYGGFVMPNLMHDLAVIVSSEECFYLTDQSHQIPQGVRHLAVDTKNLNALQQIPKQNHIRSFLYFGNPHVDGMLRTISETLYNLESVRVLDLSYLYMKKPPKLIQNLTNLRFLDLSSTGIESLSDSSLHNHYHLQALHIRQRVTEYEFQFVKLPGCINKLINLRHLNADNKTIDQISGIGQLINLQELDEYSVDETEGHKITELKNLRELTGHLRVNNWGKIKSREEAEQAILADKKYLHSVELLGGSIQYKRGLRTVSLEPRESILGKDILEGLKPYGGIKELTIMDYRDSSFPDWLTDRNHFSNLQSICLWSCRNTTVLPPLGQLPLSRLNIAGFWGMKEAPRHCFPASLKTLIIVCCHNLNSLAESLYHLTTLTHLNVSNCDIITSLDLYGLALLEYLNLVECPQLSIKGDLQLLTNLKRLYIRSCPKLVSNRMHDIMGKRKGGAQSLLSLSDLAMDRSLWHNDYHLTLGRFPSLRFLHFQGSEQGQFTEDQSLWFGELTALQEIKFSICTFTRLPSSLATLYSLKKVKLEYCSMLESLHGSGIPPSLNELDLQGCSQNLVERCQPDVGEDWQLIAHVPYIRINGRLINWPQSSAGTSGS